MTRNSGHVTPPPHVATQSPKDLVGQMVWQAMTILQELMMELYAGLLLVAIGIGYLVVRFMQLRSTVRIVKHVTTGNRSRPKNTLRNNGKNSSGSKSPGSSGKSAGRSLNRSALVGGSIQKPWGW